jgi:hypothetical protein
MAERLAPIPIDGEPSALRTRISDDMLDVPIRRIFPLWLLQRTLRLKQLTFVSPRLWDDPHEDLASMCMLTRFPNLEKKVAWRQSELAPFLAPAWAQCWSLNPGSDTLLRAYSRVLIDPIERRNTDPRNEGVTVATTPRLLTQAMQRWIAARPQFHFAIGRVNYMPEQAISQHLVNLVNGEAGPASFKTVQGRAESLMWKRDYFQHEDEVRLLCIKREHGAKEPDLQGFQFEPNETFTGISFDPRLVEFERLEREAELRRLGFEGLFVPDTSYQKLLVNLAMERDWADP